MLYYIYIYNIILYSRVMGGIDRQASDIWQISWADLPQVLILDNIII